MNTFTAVLVLLVCLVSDGITAVVDQEELLESQPPRRSSNLPWYTNGKNVDTEEMEKKTYVLKRMLKTWFEAFEHCRMLNSRLATVTSKEENDEITKLIAQEGLLENQAIWIGGTDVVIEGEWMWMSTGQPIQGYTNWHVGENQHIGSDENCLYYIKRGNNIKWGDYRCSFNTTFICEY